MQTWWRINCGVQSVPYWFQLSCANVDKSCIQNRPVVQLSKAIIFKQTNKKNVTSVIYKLLPWKVIVFFCVCVCKSQVQFLISARECRIGCSGEILTWGNAVMWICSGGRKRIDRTLKSKKKAIWSSFQKENQCEPLETKQMALHIYGTESEVVAVSVDFQRFFV